MTKMSEQGAGGMDRGCMGGHARAKSDADAVPPPPTEPPVDTRTSPTSSEDETEYTQVDQSFEKLPRRFDERSESRPQARGSSASVSRNPSSSSTRSASTISRTHSSQSQPSGPLDPPVTKATLSELDVNKIIHNPKLRHDINFDPDLHFRPNLDGEKGRRKQEKANQFWASLKEQLELFVTDREAFIERFGDDDDWCLPRLLKAVKEIIQTLVPSRDRKFLNEGLNVELLIQQFNRGVADLEKLAAWLSSVLKLHCAPMRDEWVDEMYQELSNGNRTNNIGELVKGMRSLLSVLEAMKLDVANHQIRCLRPMLIEDTVHFQQRLFCKKLQARKLNVAAARHWYSRAAQKYSTVATSADLQQSFGDMAEFFYGLSELVLPSAAPRLPETFVFDEDRVMKLRSDAIDAICLDVCMKQYEDLERLSKATQSMPQSFSLMPPTSVPSYILDDEISRSNRSSINFDFNTAPSRSSWASSSSACGSSTSSPRNSGCLFPQLPVNDAAEARAKSAKVYSSLVDLLHTAPSAPTPALRWQGLIPDVAVQILRFTNAPHDMLPSIEHKLETQLSDFGGEKFDEAQHAFHSRLFGEVAKRVREYKNLSGLGLFSAATGSRLANPGGAPGARPDAGPQFLHPGQHRSGRTSAASRHLGAGEEHGFEDMATRLAHIGVLHWRVWFDLAYHGADADGDEPMDTAPVV